MNIYHWIALIALADIALILFVRGADERRSEPTRRIKRM
jgi:hypothetical protein